MSARGNRLLELALVIVIGLIALGGIAMLGTTLWTAALR